MKQVSIGGCAGAQVAHDLKIIHFEVSVPAFCGESAVQYAEIML